MAHLVFTFAFSMLMAAPVAPDSASTDSALRARAWTSIASINDQSVMEVEWHDKVVFHGLDGQKFPYLTYDIRNDIDRNIRMQGERLELFDGQKASEGRQIPFCYSMKDGELVMAGEDGGSVIIRTDRPDSIFAWAIPSPITGLGRYLNISDLRSRAEHLLSCADLRVDSETEGIAVLRAMGKPGSRYFEHRVEIDVRTGDVLRHQLFDPRWGTLFVDWSMPVWADWNGVRLPIRTEYRVYATEVSDETKQVMREAAKREGLEPISLEPGYKYEQWVRIRDQFTHDGSVSIKLVTAWQAADSTILSVNQPRPPNWFDLPVYHKPFQVMMSEALECDVDQIKLEPSKLEPIQTSEGAAR